MGAAPTSSHRHAPLPALRVWMPFGLLLIPPLAAVALPAAYPLLLLLPFLGLTLLWVSTSPQALRQTFGLAWVGIALIVGLARGVASTPLLLATLVAATVLLVALWRQRQQESQMAAVHHNLNLMEEEVRRRQQALQRLLADVETRATVQVELLQKVQQRTDELAILNRIGDVLRTTRTLGQAQQAIGELLARLFDPYPGSLSVRSPARDHFVTVSSWGEAPGAASFDGDDCLAVRNGQEYCTTDTAPVLSPCTHLAASHAAAYLCLPLRLQGQVLGVLHLRGQPRGELSNELLHLARLTAEQVALVLANLELQETLRLQSVCDPLTGLFNRRYMEETLKREIRRAARTQKPLGLIVIDVDRLAEWNVTQGVEAGDEILRQLAVFFQLHIRGGDIACRYGADEFVLVLPEAPPQVTLQRAEWLRQGVQMLQAHQGRAAAEQLTLSIGAASFPADALSTDALLRAARTACAQALQAGGDCVRQPQEVEEVSADR